MSEKKEIFKLQVPITGEEIALAYNKDRSKSYHVPITKSLHDFMGNNFKLFVYAKVHLGQFVIDSEAPWQDW